MTSETGETTVIGEDGKPVPVTIIMNPDGSTSIVSEDGTVIATQPAEDDILSGSPSAAIGCGDGELSDTEACDDGNIENLDGCGADCLTINSGFSCVIPGEPCRPIARCGDGLVADSEQCDDGNLDATDGCSERCKIELGKKCEGEPSMCTDAVCGNGMPEGAEACDDGNTQPFDGCSAICLREPDCSGDSCTSECGDGLIINEDCDDGNTTPGDGCSATCTVEQGFTCTQETACEMLDGECILRVPAIFRDFTDAHPDFGWPTGAGGCDAPDGLPGLAAGQLDPEGRPILARTAAAACISSAETFAQWFRDGQGGTPYVGSIILFDNGDGGFVNRFGNRGDGLTAERFTSIDSTTEQGAGATLAACETNCEARARDAQFPFEGEEHLRCDDLCRPLDEEARQLRDNDLNQANNRLTQAENAAEPDADLIAEIEEEIAGIEMEIAAAEEAAATCRTDCETELAARTETCTAMCLPCSYDQDAYCIGGAEVEWDGNPLFFPLDGVMDVPASDLGEAKVPEQYGWNGWPWEQDVYGDIVMHNFYFTSEVQYWLRYDANTNATLDFTGDYDVWVFVNNQLAVDLGAIHVPLDGSVTINAQTAGQFGLEEGNVYKITVFQAERKMEGSSFKLTLSGFEARPSDCEAVCGDGVLSFGEECDDGDNDGGYGECAAECKLGEFCGDGIVNGPEACDNGPGGGEGCPNCRKLNAR
jgi:fibro-slime domain-containing protein